MKKRFFSIILVVALLMSVTSIHASAEGLEKNSIAAVAEEYLGAQAAVKYLFTEEDLTANTIASLSPEEVKAVQSTVTQAASLARTSSVTAGATANLASKITIDKEFARYMEEKAKYIQYTREAEDLGITNYSVEYGTPEIAVSDNVAQMKIRENVHMQYDGLDEMSSISTEYELDLVKVGNDWIIVDVSSDDLFDKTHSQDFDYDAAVSEYEVIMAMPSEIVVEQDVIALAEQLASSGATVYSYNHTAAANYSLTYSPSGTGDAKSYYNPNFPSYASSGGDCMNFASQCMYAGFGGSDSVSAINAMAYPMDRQGNTADELWYMNASGSTSSVTWRGTLSFQRYAALVATNLDGSIPTQNNMLVNSFLSSPQTAGIYDYQNRLPGSVVFVLDWEGDLGHAMVISKVTGSATSQVFVSGHTDDIRLQPLSQLNSSHAYRLIVPEAYYAYTNAPSLRVTTANSDILPVNTTKTLTANISEVVYQIAMCVETPSGKTVWLPAVQNTNYYSQSYTFTERGLYSITTHARKTSSAPSSQNTTHTVQIRVY